jgi:hypothetical protein
MCLYKLKEAEPLTHFFCLKLREELLECPPSCPYFIDFPSRPLAEFPYEKKCLELDLTNDGEKYVAICYADRKINPECLHCPPEKKNLLPITAINV